MQSSFQIGADVRAINNKNMTPLDMVNQYTKSNAGIEIKQLLRGNLSEQFLQFLVVVAVGK